MNQETKPRYRVPVVWADVEVSLDEFDTKEIIEYLQQQGHSAEVDGEGLYISEADLNRINTLVMCGQRDTAQQFINQLVSERIGRKL